MNIKHIILCLLGIVCMSTAMAQDVRQMRRHVRRGNRMMHTGMLDKAYEEYRKAYEADSSSSLVNYNLARSMFPKEWKIMKADAAADSTMLRYFSNAGKEQAEPNPLRRSMAYHNMGVIHQIRANQSSDQQKTQQLQQAIEAYKQALRLNPHDDEARYNLVLCQRQMKNDGQNQNQQGDNKDQQGEQQKQEQQQQQQQQDQQEQQQQEPPMSKENAEQLLQAAMQQEKQTQKRLKEQQMQQQRRQVEKNW